AYSTIENLGFIGTVEAETALSELFDMGICENRAASALIICGTSSAIAVVITRAGARTDGFRWLCEQCRHLSWTRGWTRGKYYTHINTAELVDYLDAGFQPGSSKENWDFVHALEQIDTSDVRRLLRKWAMLRGTTEDPTVREDDHLRL